jgi:hypothetical protein
MMTTARMVKKRMPKRMTRMKKRMMLLNVQVMIKTVNDVNDESVLVVSVGLQDIWGSWGYIGRVVTWLSTKDFDDVAEGSEGTYLP